MYGSPVSLKVIESRIDYVTATVHPSLKSAVVAARFADWIARRVGEGYRERSFNWMGYSGSSVDGITYGTREDGALCRLSGECASRHGITTLTWADNVSRLDLQVTVQDTKEDRNWAADVHFRSQDSPLVKSGQTRTSLIRSTPRGTTSYIGTRSSQRYFRVYDKTAESDGLYPDFCWRYEVEYKQDRANSIAAKLIREQGRPDTVREVVEASFRAYGITLPCVPLPVSWRDTAPKGETNDERRLAWLERCIKPTLEKLAEGVPMSTIVQALGLTDYISVETGAYATINKMPKEDKEVEIRVPHPQFRDVYFVSDG